MSFQTFCGKDPADAATYNKILEEFLPDTALGVVSVGVDAPLVNTGTATNPVIGVGFAAAGDLIVGTGANAGAVLGIAGRAAGDYLRINAGVNGLEWSAGAGAVPALSAVLAVGNDGNAAGITNAGVISAADIQAPFGGITSFNSTTIQDILGTGLAILPTGTLHLKGCQTKGSILAGNGATSVEVPLGAAPNGYVLTADSGAATGLAWEENGKVSSITAGTNIFVDNTLPLQPVVNLATPLTSNLNFSGVALTASSSDGGSPSIDQSIQISTSGGLLSNISQTLTNNNNSNTGLTKVELTDLVSNVETNYYDATAQQTSQSKIKAEANQSTLILSTTDAALIQNTTLTHAVSSGFSLQNITTNDSVNVSNAVRNNFTSGTSIYDTAVLTDLNTNFYNSQQNLITTNTAATIVENGGGSYVNTTKIQSTEGADSRVSAYSSNSATTYVNFVNTTADASTGVSKIEVKHTSPSYTTDMDIVADTTNCRIQQTFTAGAFNNFSDISTGSGGLNISCAGAAVSIVGSSGASLGLNANAGISAQQQVFTSTLGGTTAAPNFTYQATTSSAGNYCAVKYDRPNITSVAGDTIATQSFWADDATGATREWGRIQMKTENVIAGNQDGTLSLFTSVNGTLSEVMNFNGAQNENNSFRPLDVNGNALRTASGDLTIDASTSSGNGIITLATKNATGGLAISGDKTQSATAGGSAGTHLVITLNGVLYKIALLNP